MQVTGSGPPFWQVLLLCCFPLLLILSYFPFDDPYTESLPLFPEAELLLSLSTCKLCFTSLFSAVSIVLLLQQAGNYVPGAGVRSSTRGKGHEEGGSAYAKAGSSLRCPLGYSRASTPKNQSLPTLLLCALTSDFTGGCRPPPSRSL